MTESLIISAEFLYARKVAISNFYRVLLAREPTKDELEYYAASEEPLERVFICVKAANYGSIKDKEKLPVTAVVLAKNAEGSIVMCLDSVCGFVSEIVLLEDASTTDNTAKIAADYGARLYKAGFSDFGNMKTIVAHLAIQPWVLLVDTDEVINQTEVGLIEEMIQDDSVDIWGLPRRRWADLEMTNQVEKEAYPDWQYRLFRSSTDIRYEHRVHERIVGSDKIKKAVEGPHIEHFQDVFKTGDKLKERNSLYRRLYELDVNDGVERTCPAVAGIDDI